MLFALISPLDVIGDEYLFTAHMIQHLLLVLIVPPLLLSGITPQFARRVVECRPLGTIERGMRSSPGRLGSVCSRCVMCPHCSMPR
jgi:cytochrome c oxidase assembly factor CtaG